MKKIDARKQERKAERRLRKAEQALALERLVAAAEELSAWAPVKPHYGTSSAMIRWTLIHELRRALVDIGRTNGGL